MGVLWPLGDTVRLGLPDTLPDALCEPDTEAEAVPLGVPDELHVCERVDEREGERVSLAVRDCDRDPVDVRVCVAVPVILGVREALGVRDELDVPVCEGDSLLVAVPDADPVLEGD